ncbi:hypothetical protein [Alkalicoccus urumqiensis]|uniref:GAF domain-containing protein n=1 Tax=Alkalicoccus urumqiensis TaxID=1548213 RepID=A0A2P6MLC0_ALKUR|nr:hypothetical protein [Alkalicoccus urumqiensis]PRO67060.1 hypothetical protein C6I21_00390 [Alkalicoccus urumqiensis]
MYYKQPSHIRKLVELVIMFGGLILLDRFVFAPELLYHPLQPFLLLLVLFAVRYGVYYGAAGFFIVLAYRMLSYMTGGGDIFLLFYDPNQSMPILLELISTILVGLFSSSFRERYDSQQFVKDELQEDNEEMRRTLEQLNRTQKTLKQKVLESDYSLQRIYQIGLALDHDRPELIRSEAMSLFAGMLKAERLALYHMDSSGRALRLSKQRGEKGSFPQSILLGEGNDPFSRAAQSGEITIRTVYDPPNSPGLTAPVVVDGNVVEILAVDDPDIETIRPHDLHILGLVLAWMGTRLSKAGKYMEREEQPKRHTGTSMYQMLYFEEIVQQEEEKNADGLHPYSVVTLNVPTGADFSVVELDLVLAPLVREVDRIGYDSTSGRLSILLPGTSSENAVLVEQRIWDTLGRKGVLHESS